MMFFVLSRAWHNKCHANVTLVVCVFSPKYARGTGNDTQASPEVFQKMALRITEQWIRERVKLKHDRLGMMSLPMLHFLH